MAQLQVRLIKGLSLLLSVVKASVCFNHLINTAIEQNAGNEILQCWNIKAG